MNPENVWIYQFLKLFIWLYLEALSHTEWNEDWPLFGSLQCFCCWDWVIPPVLLNILLDDIVCIYCINCIFFIWCYKRQQVKTEGCPTCLSLLISTVPLSAFVSLPLSLFFFRPIFQPIKMTDGLNFNVWKLQRILKVMKALLYMEPLPWHVPYLL